MIRAALTPEELGDSDLVLGPEQTRETPPAPALEWTISGLSLTFVAGLYLDGWAHIRELPETFFTPWHAVIYLSFFALAGVLGHAAWRGRRSGAPWRLALPMGYGLAGIGAAVFLAAGGADLIWHEVFGIEADLEALYSPPHLLLAAGATLIVTSPLRGAWHQSQTTRSSSWRAVLSITLLLAMITFFTSESNPLVHPWASMTLRPAALTSAGLGLPATADGGLGVREIVETLGMSGVIIQSAIISALGLVMVRRWGTQLPKGWLTMLLGCSAVAASVFHSTFWTIAPAVLAGVASDVAYSWLRPSVERPRAIRWLGAILPLLLYVPYFLALSITAGIWWPVHIWTGAFVFSSATGLAMSYLVCPPALPSRA